MRKKFELYLLPYIGLAAPAITCAGQERSVSQLTEALL
jgi:hypothetical protein